MFDPRRSEGEFSDLPVVSSDVPRIVLDRLGIDDPEHFPDRPGDHLVVAENYYARAKDLFHDQWGDRFRRVRTAVFEGPYKYIQSSDGAHELYDLDSDPGEQANLFATRPEIAARLTRDLKRYQRERGSAVLPEGAPTDLTHTEVEQLRSLGYLE